MVFSSFLYNPDAFIIFLKFLHKKTSLLGRPSKLFFLDNYYLKRPPKECSTRRSTPIRRLIIDKT